MIQTTLCGFACAAAVLLAASAAPAVVICGGEKIACSADCELLDEQTCVPVCTAYFTSLCPSECCVDTGQGLTCDAMCMDVCEFSSWHNCDHGCWMNMVNLVCDDVFIPADQGCLDALCSKGFDIESYTCEPD